MNHILGGWVWGGRFPNGLLIDYFYREDHQDFVIRCQTYSNSKSSDSDRGDHRNTSYQQIRYSLISLLIRFEICYFYLLRMLIQ